MWWGVGGAGWDHLDIRLWCTCMHTHARMQVKEHVRIPKHTKITHESLLHFDFAAYVHRSQAAPARSVSAADSAVAAVQTR